MSQKEKCIRLNAPGTYVPPDLRWLVFTTKSNSYIQGVSEIVVRLVNKSVSTREWLRLQLS